MKTLTSCLLFFLIFRIGSVFGQQFLYQQYYAPAPLKGNEQLKSTLTGVEYQHAKSMLVQIETTLSDLRDKIIAVNQQLEDAGLPETEQQILLGQKKGLQDNYAKGLEQLADAKAEIQLWEGKVYLEQRKRILAFWHWVGKKTIDQDTFRFKWRSFNELYYHKSELQLLPRFSLNSSIGGGNVLTQVVNSEVLADYFSFVRVGINVAATLANGNNSTETALQARLQSLLNGGGNLGINATMPIFVINPAADPKTAFLANLKGASLMGYIRSGVLIPQLNARTAEDKPENSPAIDTVVSLNKDWAPSIETGLTASFDLVSDNNQIRFFGEFRGGYLYSGNQSFVNLKHPTQTVNGFWVVQATLGLSLSQLFTISGSYFTAFRVNESVPFQIGLSFHPR